MFRTIKNGAFYLLVAVVSIFLLSRCTQNTRIDLYGNDGPQIDEGGEGGIGGDPEDGNEGEREPNGQDEEDSVPQPPAPPTCDFLIPASVQVGQSFNAILFVASGVATSASINGEVRTLSSPSGIASKSITASSVSGNFTVYGSVTGEGGTTPCQKSYATTPIPTPLSCSLVKSSVFVDGQPVRFTLTAYGGGTRAYINAQEVAAGGGSIDVYPDANGNYFASGLVTDLASNRVDGECEAEFYPPRCTLSASTSAYNSANLTMTLYGPNIASASIDGTGLKLPDGSNTISFLKTGSTSGTAIGVIKNTAGEQTSCSVNYTITPRPEYSIWSDGTVPPWVERDSAAALGLELGMKFQVSAPGKVYGIRFYKDSRMGGWHRGSLWNKSTGALLSTVQFTGETTSGWQKAYFASPIDVAANTTYIVSYYSRSEYFPKSGASKGGIYHTTSFQYSHSNGPITGLAAGTDGANGVFMYGNGDSSPLYPSNTHDKSNYWVDVIFSPNF